MIQRIGQDSKIAGANSACDTEDLTGYQNYWSQQYTGYRGPDRILELLDPAVQMIQRTGQDTKNDGVNKRGDIVDLTGYQNYWSQQYR